MVMLAVTVRNIDVERAMNMDSADGRGERALRKRNE